jgi:hypothetical protein
MKIFLVCVSLLVIHCLSAKHVRLVEVLTDHVDHEAMKSEGMRIIEHVSSGDRHFVLVKIDDMNKHRARSTIHELTSEKKHAAHAKTQLRDVTTKSHLYGTTVKVLLWDPESEETLNEWRSPRRRFTVIRNNENEPSVIIEMQQSDRSAILSFLPTLKNVRAVENWSRPKHLDAFGNYIIQSDSATACNISSPYLGCTPLWNAGLDGSGQILGIGDSGINMRQCFFNDASCSASTDHPTSPPTCGGSYLAQPCSPCVNYCTSGDGVSCVPPSSDHRIMKSFRSTLDNYLDNAYKHGTEVSAVAVGSGDPTSSPGADIVQNRGAAPAARLVFQDLAAETGGLNVPVPLDSEYFEWFKLNGAHVSSQSWGSDPVNVGYTSDSQSIDSFVWDNPTHLPVFAAGNSGDANLIGAYLLLGPEASTKNSLVVGATMTELNAMLLFPSFCSAHGITPSSDPIVNSPEFLAWFSSTGPTLDGRIKPDIVAPGVLTITAKEDAFRPNTPSAQCSLAASAVGVSGTSFSCPLMAAYAVVMRQWLVSGGYKGIAFPAPSAALLKNLLLVNARKLRGINYLENGYVTAATLDSSPLFSPYGSEWVWGFGRPLLESMTANSSNTFIVDSLSTAAMTTQSVTAPAFSTVGQEIAFCVESASFSSNTLSMAMVYTDFPGAVPSASTAHTSRLVNDLDLWAVNAACQPQYANGQSSLDQFNNVERVQIPVTSSISQFYVVVLRASRVSVGPQGYSLAMAMDDAHAGAFLGSNQIVLSLTNTSTNFPSLHPCSQIYSFCKPTFDALRVNSVTPPPVVSTSSRDYISLSIVIVVVLLAV